MTVHVHVTAAHCDVQLPGITLTGAHIHARLWLTDVERLFAWQARALATSSSAHTCAWRWRLTTVRFTPPASVLPASTSAPATPRSACVRHRSVFNCLQDDYFQGTFFVRHFAIERNAMTVWKFAVGFNIYMYMYIFMFLKRSLKVLINKNVALAQN